MSSRPPNDIMTVERSFQRNRLEEIRSELWRELLKLAQGKLVQLAPALKTEPHSIADNLVRLAERYTLVRKIRRRSHSIQISALCRRRIRSNRNLQRAV